MTPFYRTRIKQEKRLNMDKRNILITGGAGFIGSHLVRHFVKKYPEYKIINLDALTYAGDLSNLADIEKEPNYMFVNGDICNKYVVKFILEMHKIDGIIHLAAESHVDNSIKDPTAFLNTNILGTFNLLQSAKECWEDDFSGKRFHHVSTDEVYGALSKDDAPFTELNRYEPHSPYSASKAASDHLVRAYHDTYKFPITISNCSNNYGPNQYPEKLIPLFIQNILNEKPLPVYGTGENIRDWLFVEDHCKAIDKIFHDGKDGETYNIGGNNERTNIDIIHTLIRMVDAKLGREEGYSEKLITFVEDRKGHDLRYAIDASKIKEELGWHPEENFDSGFEKTVDWYLSNQDWLKHIKEKKKNGR